MSTNAANTYGAIQRETAIDGASPHRLIALLLENGVSRLKLARRQLKDQSWPDLHLTLGKTLAVVHELQGSLLNPDSDVISTDLYHLYSHVSSNIIEANSKREESNLVTAQLILETLLDGWNGIEPKEI